MSQTTADRDLGTGWAGQLVACRANPAYFVHRFGVIDQPKGPSVAGEPATGGTGGTVPFRLWPDQVPVMKTLATARLVLILKARQLGISWLVCGYVLWLCLFRDAQVVFLYSKDQAAADELIRRIRALYDRLPGELRARLPRPVGRGKIREIEWGNGSRVRSMPATKNAGISFTATCVVLDEWAHQTWGGDLYESVKPIIEQTGQLIVLSTANGMGNWFHSLWRDATRRLNSFRTVFLPWWSRPGRDRAWYEGVLRDSNDPEKVLENYPGNPIEAFRGSGRSRFPAAWIEAQLPNLREPLPLAVWPARIRGIPGLRLYGQPVPGRRYVLPADVSEGLLKGDADACPILDRETREELGTLHGRWEPDVFAGYLIEIGYAFNGAVIVPERNNHGHAVLATLKLRGYPNVGLGHDGAPGWVTSARTKDAGVDLLAEGLRLGTIAVRTQAALSEMQDYSRLKNGSTGAPAGGYDDLVMAWVVGLSWIRHVGAEDEARARRRKVQSAPSPLAGYRG
jgi:hypothetical protein